MSTILNNARISKLNLDWCENAHLLQNEDDEDIFHEDFDFFDMNGQRIEKNKRRNRRRSAIMEKRHLLDLADISKKSLRSRLIEHQSHTPYSSNSPYVTAVRICAKANKIK